MRFGRILCQKVAAFVDHYSHYQPQSLSLKTLVDFAKGRSFIFVRRSHFHSAENWSESWNETAKHYDKYSRYHPSAVTLQQLCNFGTDGSESKSFAYLRNELLVRLANIMKEFDSLPEHFLKMPSTAMVRSWYRQSFTQLLQFEKYNESDPETLHNFTAALDEIRKRHSNVVQTMAQGVMEYQAANGLVMSDKQMQNVPYFLDRFYTNRISIRMLINQHVLLYGKDVPKSGIIGSIDTNCNVMDVVNDAFSSARFLCEQYYMLAPDLIRESYNSTASIPDAPIEMVYIPSHLYHMLFELFKNAMRAVVERHSRSIDVPPLRVRVCKGEYDVSIKLSDEGGGTTIRGVEDLFQYLYTTAPQPLPSHSREGGAPLAGYGYGLPLSRLYARYFQGDLILIPQEGFGMDAIVYLKVLSDEANERIPVYNITASKVYESDVQVSDWSNQISRTPTNNTRHYSTRTSHH